MRFALLVVAVIFGKEVVGARVKSTKQLTRQKDELTDNETQIEDCSGQKQNHSEDNYLNTTVGDPMDEAVIWLKQEQTALDKSILVGGKLAHLKFQKFGKGVAEFKVFSDGAGKDPAKCLEVKVRPAHMVCGGKERASEIQFVWVGNDPLAANPCAFTFETMKTWLQKLVDWNFRWREYEFTTVGDGAYGQCKYLKDGVEEQYHGAQPHLSMLSLLKYGMPFYTHKAGLFPISVLEDTPERKGEYCTDTKNAMVVGEQTLDKLYSSFDAESAEMIRKVASRMGKAKTTKLGDLLQDKMWSEVQPSEEACRENSDLAQVLRMWPCKENNGQCSKDHALLSKLNEIPDIYGRYVLNPKWNGGMVCPWYSYRWTFSHWWYPNLWNCIGWLGSFF